MLIGFGLIISTYKAHLMPYSARPYSTSLNPAQYLNLTTTLLTINSSN